MNRADLQSEQVKAQRAGRFMRILSGDAPERLLRLEVLTLVLHVKVKDFFLIRFLIVSLSTYLQTNLRAPRSSYQSYPLSERMALPPLAERKASSIVFSDPCLPLHSLTPVLILKCITGLFQPRRLSLYS